MNLIEGISNEIIYMIVGVAVTNLFSFALGAKRANMKLCQQISELKVMIIKIQKCMVVQAQMADALTERLHPKERGAFEDITKELLSNGHGKTV